MNSFQLTSDGFDFLCYLQRNALAREKRDLETIDLVTNVVRHFNLLSKDWNGMTDERVLPLIINDLQIIVKNQAVFEEFADQCELAFPSQSIRTCLANLQSFQLLESADAVDTSDIAAVQENIRLFAEEATPLILNYALYLQRQKTDMVTQFSRDLAVPVSSGP